jgi:tripartite-type tricarboxylate transporter receptor subunit TctC
VSNRLPVSQSNFGPPKDIIARLNGQVRKALADADVRRKLEEQGLPCAALRQPNLASSRASNSPNMRA